MDTKNENQYSILFIFLCLLSLVLTVAKLWDETNLSWWVVFLPVYIGPVLVLLSIIIYSIGRTLWK